MDITPIAMNILILVGDNTLISGSIIFNTNDISPTIPKLPPNNIAIRYRPEN